RPVARRYFGLFTTPAVVGKALSPDEFKALDKYMMKHTAFASVWHAMHEPGSTVLQKRPHVVRLLYELTALSPLLGLIQQPSLALPALDELANGVIPKDCVTLDICPVLARAVRRDLSNDPILLMSMAPVFQRVVTLCRSACQAASSFKLPERVVNVSS